jgi:hypothetical protein
MQRTRIAVGIGVFLVIAGPGAAQTPAAQPAEQKPINPTQEIAKEQAEGPALEAGPAVTAPPCTPMPTRRRVNWSMTTSTQ